MKKFYAKATRDFTRTINMGALIVCGMPDGSNQEIAPPRSVVLESKEGQTYSFRSKSLRDAYIANVNAEIPGAVVAE